jgi:hypothetical protein
MVKRLPRKWKALVLGFKPQYHKKPKNLGLSSIFESISTDAPGTYKYTSTTSNLSQFGCLSLFHSSSSPLSPLAT